MREPKIGDMINTTALSTGEPAGTIATVTKVWDTSNSLVEAKALYRPHARLFNYSIGNSCELLDEFQASLHLQLKEQHERQGQP